MIINFRATKTFIYTFAVTSSILLNVWAINNLNCAEKSLAGCEQYIEQIQTYGAQLQGAQ